jgi:hypothetical protein
LRVASDGVGAGLDSLQVAVGQFLIVAFAVEPCEGLAIALHAQRQVHVVGVVCPAAANGGIRTDQDVDTGLAVADVEPQAGIIECWASGFLEFQRVVVEAARAIKIVDAEKDMMQIEFLHGDAS